MIRIEKLNKRFGRRVVLHDLAFEMDAHVYGLLGPNGSGKTTLIRCLTGLYPEGKHCITVDAEHGGADWRMRLGYLPQRFGMFPDLKVREMLQMMANLQGVPQSVAEQRLIQAVEAVGLSDRIDSRVGTLSGGMIRRLGISQALLCNPSVLILDEPTAGLDPEERLRFKSLIGEIRQDRCVLISTHIVADVEAICDRILILKEGRIAAQGSGVEIQEMARGRVYDLAADDLSQMAGQPEVFKRYEVSGTIRLRVLSDREQNIPPVAPTIEDGYMAVMKNLSCA